MILTPFDTPCIMIENLSDTSANDLFKHKCLRLKDEYTKKYIDFYNTERYRRYGVTGILPAEYTHEYNCISNEWQRKVLTVGIGTDVVIVVLKHIQMFQYIYKRMEGLPISIEGNRENEKKVLMAVRILLDSADTIEIFNKKAIYLYLREITGLNTKQVVNNLNKLRKRYRIFKDKWESGEI